MILNRLSVFNFGIYRGQQEFNLRPQDGQPLGIFGGKNGAGKTTLLEAVRLCLYGPQAWGPAPLRKAEYEAYLDGRIHRAPDNVIPIDVASLELEFEYALAGVRHIYAVKREWGKTGKGIKHNLQVFEDGQPMVDVNTDQQSDFLRDLILPGLSPLLFFDAEQFQVLSREQGDNLALSQATRALLGLDIVEQLRADLSTYRRQQQRQGEIDSAERQLQELEDELTQAKAEIEKLSAQIAEVSARRREIEERIDLQEAKIARAGGGFARRREEHKTARTRLEADIEATQTAIRELCAGLLPLAITPEYTGAVRDQLLREAEYRQWLASKAFIEDKLEDIQAEIEEPHFWQGTGAEVLADLQKTIGRRVSQALQRMVEPPESVRETELRHQASPPEQRQILSWIEESQTAVPQQLRELTAKLDRLNQEYHETVQALLQVPSDDMLAPLVKELNAYNQELGRVAEQEHRLEEEGHRLELEAAELERKLRQVKEKRDRYGHLSDKIQRAIDVDLVLDDFAQRLTGQRVAQLAEAFVRNFNRLCRKDQLIQGAKINPRDFSLSLVGDGQGAIVRGELSAGENQIYAIAMLWALRQVSGRPLPLLIDAPLGRLDRDHRQNLVDFYFPRVSHQVILLSTDTEVDAEFFAAMSPQVARAYHLVYDEGRRATVASEGYFWEMNGRGPA